MLMFNALFDCFKAGLGITHMTSLMNSLQQVVAHLAVDYVKDADAKDLAIDAICEMLQASKNPK